MPFYIGLSGTFDVFKVRSREGEVFYGLSQTSGNGGCVVCTCYKRGDVKSS